MPNRPLIAAVLFAAAFSPLASAAPRTLPQVSPALSDRQAADLALRQLEGRTELGLENVRQDLTLRSVTRDSLGQVHVRFNQRIRGIPVYGGQVIAHLRADGSLRDITDALSITAGLPALRPSITPGIALRGAMADFAQGTSETPFVDLVLFETFDGDMELTYQVKLVDIESDTPAEHMYFISAVDGEIVFDFDNLHTRAAEGDGRSLYSGTVDLTTDSVAAGYQMIDPSRGDNVITNMGNSTAGDGAVFTDTDNHWGTGLAADAASAAVDAHFGGIMTWDFFKERLGRSGIAGNGKGSLGRVHYGNNYNNAYWSDSCFCMTYGDGDGRTLTALVAIDVVGHEMSHGVTSTTSGLMYSWEAGGLNEGFSDIMGTAVEFYADEQGYNTTPDYLIGEDLYTPGTPGDALRYMDEPSKDGRSIDHASKMRLWTDPHYSSGVPNNAFYLAAHGGTNKTSGQKVNNPIGVDKAAAIFYSANANYLTTRSRFSDARDATERAATELYGATEAATISAAWAAVGVN
jgi:Zn-dependent metalloprotease